MTTGQLYETRHRRSGHAHWRTLDGSDDLQRLLSLLLSGERYTPLAISNLAHVMYNPAIWELDAELQRGGIAVQHQRVDGKQYHEYWLAPEDLPAARARLQQAMEGGESGKQVEEGAQGVRVHPASEAGQAVAGVDGQEEARQGEVSGEY